MRAARRAAAIVALLIAGCAGPADERGFAALETVVATLRGEGLLAVDALRATFDGGERLVCDRHGNVESEGFEPAEAEAVALLLLHPLPSGRYTLTPRRERVFLVTSAAGEVWSVQLEAPGRPRSVRRCTPAGEVSGLTAVLERRTRQEIAVRLERDGTVERALRAVLDVDP